MLSSRPLSSFIKTEYEETIREAIASFSCKDKDVESFLKNKAFEFEKRNKSRTYLIYDKIKLVEGEFILFAYFTLSLKSLQFCEELPKTRIRDIDGFSKDVSGVAIPLIGQFGKDEKQASDIPGKDIFDLCMSKIYQVHSLIGGRHVLIECQEIDKIVEFYENNGFKILQKDNNDGYLQLVRKL